MWESFWWLFLFPPGKRASCFVPGGLLCQDFWMMGKMFSLRVNLWRKKLILRAVIQLITQGQEDKGHIMRMDCCAWRANGLFWLHSEWCECSGNHTWILVNAGKYFLFQVQAAGLRCTPGWCILSHSGSSLAMWHHPELGWRRGFLLKLWLVLFLSGKHWQSAGGFEGFCTLSNLVFYHQLTLGSSNPREDKEGERRVALDTDKFVIVDSQVSAVRGLWRMTDHGVSWRHWW